MAKHRRQSVTAKRSIATASAIVAGATLFVPANANAAQVTVPNSGFSTEVPGIENVPGIANVPGIDQWIPSLAGKADSNADVRAAIAAVKNVPGVNNVPGFSQWIAGVEAKYAPAPAKTEYRAATKAAAPVPAPKQSQGDRIVSIAKSKIGSPYVYGAAGPNAFDCSGFTSWVYAQAGKQIPRTSGAQASAGKQVAISDLQPGDVVVYYSGASHVAIYAGNGQIIDALNSGTPVGYRPLNYMPIHSAVRF
ncbi:MULTISPECIES: C40 family peptidase [unclassified Corynebacterium]|uniref:C40 family peptidase n=1 Tax=unclassified Corynebacterium TaxID=2624378 RepID=UPI00265156A6|nr:MULTISPECIES: C40 family peptidase [unclassified Corynebacterium]MDN8593587.1 NlpC/P60 family protein [Corynebacterium sp. P4_F2]WKK55715.1 NlpC/P60 family protein [Corynebacterium sp. P4-C1]WKK63123.1 NlpC/P60 family protein [Corynebacterium sp. P8-C1]